MTGWALEYRVKVSTVASGRGERSRLASLVDIGPGAFRMLLALLVFVSHVSRYEVGRPAVFLFFILSGYWVVRLFESEGRDARRFGLNRLLRVWPLLAVCAVFVVALTAMFGLPLRGDLASTLALIGLASRGGDVVGVAWSLDIEVQFYILVVVTGLAVQRLPRLPDLAGCGLIAALLTTVGVALLSRDIWTVFAFLPAFAAGAAIHLAAWRASRRTAVLSLAAFAAVGGLFVVVPAFNTLLLKTESDWWRDLVHMGWCLLLTPFIAYNVRRPSPPVDRHLGNLSFPFYLAHPVIIRVAEATIPAPLVMRAGALAAALAVSLVLYLLIDRPLERLRHRLMRRGVPVAVRDRSEQLATM